MISENYKEKIKTLDESQSTEVILNDSQNDATDLFEQLIGNAKQTINILSEKLELYDTDVVVDLLQEATNNGVQVQVLLDGVKESISKDNKFLMECIKNEKCEVRISNNPIDSHIITRDGMAYRYCSKNGSHKAIASFNGTEVVDNADKKIFNPTAYEKYPEYYNK